LPALVFYSSVTASFFKHSYYKNCYRNCEELHIGGFTFGGNLIDCFTRRLLLQVIGYSLPSSVIVPQIEKLLKERASAGLIIRIDNGPEFRSYRFKELLENYKVTHESIHIKHPEENSYIEGFHSILEVEVLSRQEFDSLEELKDTLKR